MSEKAVIVDLGVGSAIVHEAQRDSPKQHVVKEIRKQYFIDQHLIDDNTAEVDLHIEKLCEKSMPEDSGMILKIQFDYYIKCLESAMDKKLTGKRKKKCCHKIKINIPVGAWRDL